MGKRGKDSREKGVREGNRHKCFRVASICRPGDFFSSSKRARFSELSARRGVREPREEGKGREGWLAGTEAVGGREGVYYPRIMYYKWRHSQGRQYQTLKALPASSRFYLLARVSLSRSLPLPPALPSLSPDPEPLHPVHSAFEYR